MQTAIQNEHLALCYAQLVACQEAIKEFSTLTKAQLNWKIDAKKWSVAECLNHLEKASAAYYAQVAQIIREAQVYKNKPTNSYKATIAGKLLMSFVNPKSKRKIPAPAFLKPSQSAVMGDILQAYNNTLTHILDMICQADQKQIDLNKVKVKSSLSSLIKFNLGDYFEVEAMHHARHIAQAKRVIQHANFPNT